MTRPVAVYAAALLQIRFLPQARGQVDLDGETVTSVEAPARQIDRRGV